MKRLLLAALLLLVAPAARARADEAPPPAKILSQPDRSFTYESPKPYPSLAWLALQLVPSPEFAVGQFHRIGVDGRSELETPVSFGLNWQMTPVLWSWGTNRHINRWRWFVVDPLARVSGSLEADLHLEYLWGEINRMLVRPAVRANFPLVQRGEYLSMSIGTSAYQLDGAMHVAYDAGLYVLWGTLGAVFTVAPTDAPLTSMITFRIRFF